MQIIEKLKPTEGEPGQWLGVYITKWRPFMGNPTAMFRRVDVQDSVPEVKALVEAARALLDTARTEYANIDYNVWRVPAWLESEPTVAALDAALAPFKDDAE